jgi:hypothetical protein
VWIKVFAMVWVSNCVIINLLFLSSIQVEKALPKVAEVADLKHYMRHPNLLQTLWKVTELTPPQFYSYSPCSMHFIPTTVAGLSDCVC